MKTFLVVLVVVWSCILAQAVHLEAAQEPQAPSVPSVSIDERTEVETLKRLGQQMGDAMIARDIAALDRIFADDWLSIGSTGRSVKKDSVLEKFRNGTDTLESFELGPMDVLVLGNIAAVRGTVTEKRHRDGKDVSGELLYMDLLEKRDGTWVVVRSTGKRLK